MWRRVVQILGGLVFVLVALAMAFLLSMRSKYPPVLDAVRRINRSVGNPRAMKNAGQPGAYAGIIQHIGRNSGTEYETPIGPYSTEDGFVVALPYGTRPDWLKNVMAAGRATIVSEGESYDVADPLIISAGEALPSIPPKEQRTTRMFNVNEFLKVRIVEPQDPQNQLKTSPPEG